MLILILALIGATCFGLYVSLLARNVLWGWASLLFVDWYNLSFGTDQSLLGSLHVDPLDLVMVALLIAGVYRFYVRLRTDSGTAQTVIIVFVSMFLFSLVRGLINFDIRLVGVESRVLVWPIIGMLYFFTIPRDQETIKQFVLFYIYCGGALFIIGLFAYAGFHVGGVAWAHLDSEVADERLLPASASCQIALSAVLLLSWISYRKSQRWMFPAATAFLAMAILVRTRTVWLMLLGVFLATPLVDLKIFKKAIPMLIVGALATLLLGAGLYASRGGLSEQLEESASQSSTFEWRVLGWEELLSLKDQTAMTILAGKDVGNGFLRIDPAFGTYVNLPPHNEYIAEYLRVGVIGMLAGILLIVRPIYLLSRLHPATRRDLWPSPSAWKLICIGLLIYGVTYSVNIDGWAFIGVANALLLNPVNQVSTIGVGVETKTYTQALTKSRYR